MQRHRSAGGMYALSVKVAFFFSEELQSTFHICRFNQPGVADIFYFMLSKNFLATLHGMQDPNSLTGDLTLAPCSGRGESQPLGRQGSLLENIYF